MNLAENQINKIDPLLKEFLINAKGDEKIRVIMALGDKNQLSNSQVLPTLEHGNFSSPTAYRQALIELRKNQLSESIGKTIQELQNLSLNPLGGIMNSVVVVEGSATDISKAMELPGVNSALLDQEVNWKCI